MICHSSSSLPDLLMGSWKLIPAKPPAQSPARGQALDSNPCRQTLGLLQAALITSTVSTLVVLWLATVFGFTMPQCKRTQSSILKASWQGSTLRRHMEDLYREGEELRNQGGLPSASVVWQHVFWVWQWEKGEGERHKEGREEEHKRKAGGDLKEGERKRIGR